MAGAEGRDDVGGRGRDSDTRPGGPWRVIGS